MIALGESILGALIWVGKLLIIASIILFVVTFVSLMIFAVLEESGRVSRIEKHDKDHDADRKET